MKECPYVPLSIRNPNGYDLNAAHVGQPLFKNPEGARELPTIISNNAAGTNQRTLVFKMPDYHFFAYEIRLSLYSYSSADEEITYIDPNSTAGSIASPVYIKMRASYMRMDLSSDFMHWSTVQGTARQPHILGAPIYVGPGANFELLVRNESPSQDFAISVQLVGTRVSAGKVANMVRRKLPVQEFIKAERRYTTPLVGNPDTNVRLGGIPRFLTLPEGSDGRVTYSSGTYGSPTVAGIQRIATLSRYTFFGKYLTGTQITGDNSLRDAQPNQPIMVRIRSQRYNQYLTDGFVPFGHVFGDQQFPGWLPVDYVLPENDGFEVEAKNIANADVECAYGCFGINRE